MTNIMYAQMLVGKINSYYEKEKVYFGKGKDFGKCFTTEGDMEIGNWGLKEWAKRIGTGVAIGDIPEFYRR